MLIKFLIILITSILSLILTYLVFKLFVIILLLLNNINKMKVIIINGSSRVGKDQFANFFKKHYEYKSVNWSTIDKVKKIIQKSAPLAKNPVDQEEARKFTEFTKHCAISGEIFEVIISEPCGKSFYDQMNKYLVCHHAMQTGPARTQNRYVQSRTSQIIPSIHQG